jgi:myo-inositol 2-dehydrogenase/D-chiro-inositol 1-dehydrogenase
MTEGTPDTVSRRTFIHTTAAASAAVLFSGAHIAGSDVIRVGLVGCGGRGTGAARDCLRGSEGIELVALGDLFPEAVAKCRAELTKAVEGSTLAASYKVTDERCFSGFDAYEAVLASGIDLVILATPPAFRPLHLAAAVNADKHIFAEKPVAVDPAGIRSVLATYEKARERGLAIGVGTQRRHQAEYVPTVQRIHDGAIGDVLSGQVFWNQGGLWVRDRQPEWTDAEWQIRNWLYFTWLSGTSSSSTCTTSTSPTGSSARTRSRRPPSADGSGEPIRSSATYTITSPWTTSIPAARG